jgi:hypothetical protein
MVCCNFKSAKHVHFFQDLKTLDSEEPKNTGVHFSIFFFKILEVTLIYRNRKEGDMPREYTLSQVAVLIGIPYYRIYYGHYTGKIPEPKRVGRNRIYTVKDVQKIKEHFAKKEAK